MKTTHLRNGKTAGVAHHRAKLNEEKAEQIRQRAANGEKQSALAQEFGVTQKTISTVVLGKTWAAERTTTKKVTASDLVTVQKMRQLVHRGKPYGITLIAQKLGCTFASVRKLVNKIKEQQA